MDVLVLSGGGHAQRGEQTFEAATITARLSADEEYVRVIELRGDARVAGGGGALRLDVGAGHRPRATSRAARRSIA